MIASYTVESSKKEFLEEYLFLPRWFPFAKYWNNYLVEIILMKSLRTEIQKEINKEILERIKVP